MAKVLSEKSQAARERIDRTKPLSLDRRCEVIRDAIGSLGIGKWNSSHGPALAKWLESNGYEPMMFVAAHRLWLSRQRAKD